MTPRIGVVGPLSGERSAWGELFMEAFERGRAGQSGVAFVVRDDGGDEQAAEAIAAELVAGGVACVVGHYASAGAAAAAQVYAAAGVVLVAPASTDPDLTGGPAPVLRLCAHDGGQVGVIRRWLGGVAEETRTLVVCDSTRYGRRLSARIAAALTGARTCAAEQAATLAGAGGVDAIVFAGTHVRAALMLRELAAAGYAGAVLATDDAHTDDLASRAQEASEGCFVTRPTPDYAQTTTEAVRLAALALARRPEARGRALLRALAAAEPSISFDRDGNRKGAGWGLSRVAGGRLHEVTAP